jgi:non-ribosomal peptide synthetase component E (peptide arylation enzyme)
MRTQATPNIYFALAMLALAWYTPSASALQDNDGSMIDGFIARQARRERGEEYREARKVTVGDLTHDGVPETVVLYTIESQGGTNNYVQYVAVFARGNRGLIPVTHTEVGGKMRRSVELSSVEDNAIQLATLSYGPKDASCCPSVKGTTRYALVGRALREQKHSTTRVRHDEGGGSRVWRL